MLGWYFQGCSELGEMGFGLIMNLFLDRRQIHGDVAAISQAERLDHVHYMQFCLIGVRKSNGSFGDSGGFFGQVYRQHDSLVTALRSRHVASPS